MALPFGKCLFSLCIYLLFSTEIIGSIRIKHQNIKPKISSRVKREDIEAPEKIKIHVKDGSNSETLFEVSKVEPNHIANDKLKIWTVHTKTSEPDNSWMKEYTWDKGTIGTWVMYQNYKTKSAVTYFPKHKLLSGIVGQKYEMKYIFYNGSENVDYNVTSNEENKSKKRRETNDILEFLDSSYVKNKLKRSADTQLGKPEPQFYLESLVLISGTKIDSLLSSVTNLYNKNYEYYVIHVLSFLNIIDMFLTKSNFEVNIAGIVVRNEGRDFPFLQDSMKKEKLIFDAANNALLNFLYRKKSNFNRDPFDYVIYLTDHFIFHEKSDKTMNDSLIYPLQGIYKAKQLKSDHPYPIIMTQSGLTYATTKSAAAKIVEMVSGLNYVKKFNTSDNDNFLFIDDFFDKCQKVVGCFEWNEDYCNYVNKPASLQNTPRVLLTVNDQCWCHNEKYYYENKTNETIANFCTSEFQCLSENTVVMNVSLVMDGTPCEENKVCWNSQCVTQAL